MVTFYFFTLILICFSIFTAYSEDEMCEKYRDEYKAELEKMNDCDFPLCYLKDKDEKTEDVEKKLRSPSISELYEWEEMVKEQGDELSPEETMEKQAEMWDSMNKSQAENTWNCMVALEVAVQSRGIKPSEDCGKMIEEYKIFVRAKIDEKE